jgi:small subunit ribosomal protein S3
MGQKSNPIGLRLQINRTWDSRWYAGGADYSRLLLEDLKLREYIFKNLPRVHLCCAPWRDHRQKGWRH